jgi:cytochrome P450
MTAAIGSSEHTEAEDIVRELITAPPQDPYPLYTRLREIDPIHRASVGDFWTLTRYADLSAAVKDKRFLRDPVDMQRRHIKNATINYDSPFFQSMVNWFVFSNPPEYVPKRAIYGSAFSRTYVETLRPMMVGFANDLLDAAQQRGEMEIVKQLGFDLTVRVISHVMGVPLEDSHLLVDYVAMVGGTFDPMVTPGWRQKADEETIKLEPFLRDLIAKARKNPGDNLLGRLITLDETGELNEDELMANIPLVFAAGLQTTTHFIGNSVYSFMRNPDQWALFLTDPDGLVENAVEELLRYETSVLSEAPLRFASEDIEIGGVTIGKGEAIVPFYGAVNHDPDRYEDPQRLNILREDIRTLAFGGGLHICLGQFIARLETQVALVQLAKRFPQVHLREGEAPVWHKQITNRSVEELHVRLS